MIRPLVTARRLLGSLRRRRAQAELDEEIGFHLAMETEENLRRGLSPIEARRAAQRSFGRIAHTKRDYQEARGLPWLEDAAGDVVLAARSLVRAPAFTSVIILLMGLGIGASTAVFTVVDGVLLRPLPYPNPDELAELSRVGPNFSFPTHDYQAVSQLRRANDETQTVAGIGALDGLNVADGDLTFHAQALPVSHEYVAILGMRPEIGRPFEAADEHAGAAPVAILSHALARRLGDDAMGRSIRLGGVPHRIVGILPRGARTVPAADLLLPLRPARAEGGTNYFLLARLRGGPAAAEQRLAAFTSALHREGRLDKQVRLRWLGLDEARAESGRGTILLLFAAVSLVLFIACINVAGLLIIKAQRRRAELAVRAALGARPGRLIRQLVTESMVYAAVGGLLGLALAHAALNLLLHMAPPDLGQWSIGVVSRALFSGADHGIGIDGRVLLFSLALTAATGVACGLVPALLASRVDLRQAMVGGASGVAASAPRGRWRRGFLVGQLALSTLLLLGAGLLTRTLLALRAVEAGFDPSSVLAMTMSPEDDSDDRPLDGFFAQALDGARQVPGVRAVALAGAVPGRTGPNMPIRIPGAGADFIGSVGWRYVSPGYFELLAIPVESGRALSDRDTRSGQSVVVINRALARAHFRDRDPLGRQLVAGAGGFEDVPRTIVGVVGDTRDDGPKGDPEPRMYVPFAQVPPQLFADFHRWFDTCWLVATDLEPAAAADRIGAVFRALRPGLPFSEVARLEDVVAAQVASERFLAWLLAAFALAGLCIAAAGIYGLSAYSVSQRSREIAIRIALGATPAAVVRGIVGEGAIVAGTGILLGLAAAWPLAPVLASFLYGTAPFDPVTAAAAAAVLLAAAALASLAPAARAARIDPVSNLRRG